MALDVNFTDTNKHQSIPLLVVNVGGLIFRANDWFYNQQKKMHTFSNKEKKFTVVMCSSWIPSLTSVGFLLPFSSSDRGNTRPGSLGAGFRTGL